MERGVEQLRVWQESRRLAVEVYRATKKFPSDERYNLTVQIRRAATSVMSNIAEGQGRYSRKDFARFLHLARGSLAEVQSLIILSGDLEYLDNLGVKHLMGITNAVGPMLNGLIHALQDGYQVHEHLDALDSDFYE